MRFSTQWLIKGLILAAMPISMSYAQSRGGEGGYYIEFEEPEPSPTPDPAATPSPTPKPTPAPPPPRKQRYVPPPNPDLPAYDDPILDEVTRPELTRFAGDREFEAYVERSEELQRKRQGHWEYVEAQDRPQRGKIVAGWAGPQDTGEECTDPEMCPTDDKNMVVTGSKATPPSITNNQTAGVDEGDIVKQLGDYFLVLQDGRIFAVNASTMKLTDRVDVYRRDKDGDPIGADWYDEMLVQDDHVLITAYSYEDDATELSVFKLDQVSGKLARVGVFLISSDDYYDASNYATRIVGDRLVIYTPYDIDNLVEPDDRPFIRRWQGPEEREDDQRRGKAWLNRAIYIGRSCAPTNRWSIPSRSAR